MDYYEALKQNNMYLVTWSICHSQIFNE